MVLPKRKRLWLYYRSLFGIYSLFVPDKDMGSTVLKGSGEAFSSKELKAMKAAIHQHTRNHAYRQHDVVMLDNHRIAHGREIYLGPKLGQTFYTCLDWDRFPTVWERCPQI